AGLAVICGSVRDHVIRLPAAISATYPSVVTPAYPNPIYPTYPRVVVQLTPGQQQVVEWYQTYLGRYPDATGLRNWGGMLDAGYPRNAVLAGILGSAEYYQLKGGTPTRFVRGLCRDVVGRWPTPLA